MPSREDPLEGACVCGAVRFQVTQPFETAGYCHCTRCQRRTGTTASVNGRVSFEGFEIVAGADSIHTWQPPEGQPKSFCKHCGGHLFSGDPERGPVIGVRLGLIDGDPGIRPEWRQWISSAPSWESNDPKRCPQHS